MSKRKQVSISTQQNMHRNNCRVGYFLEDTFNQTEQAINQNDSLELKTKNYSRLTKNACRNSFNSTNNSTSFNCNPQAKLNTTNSPRLMTASTTQRSFINNSNLLNSISNTQTSRFNNNLSNSYHMSPQYNYSLRNLKDSTYERNQKLSLTSINNNNSNNIFLDDNFQINDSEMKKKLNKSMQSQQQPPIIMNLSNKKNSSKLDQYKNRSTYLPSQQLQQQHKQQDMANDHILETPLKKPQVSIQNQVNLYQQQNALNQSQPTQLSIQINSKSIESTSPLKINNTKMNPVNAPIQNKLYLSTKNFNNRNAEASPLKNLPMTARLHEYIDNKVKEKFFKNLNVNPKNDKQSNLSVTMNSSQRDLSNSMRDQNSPLEILTPLSETKRKINRDSGNFMHSYQFLREKESVLDHINNQFQYFLSEYKRVSNMNKLSTTYRQGISNLYTINYQCTNKLLSRINEWQEIKKGKIISDSKKTKNIVEHTADCLAVDVFISKNPMQIMCVSLACAKIYLSLKRPIKAIPILKQCKRLSDLYRNQKYKMKCYKSLSEAFMMIRKEQIAEKFIKKYLQLSWCIKSEKNELLAYDMLGLLSYYNGDIERAKFYHHRMANNILEEESSQLKKISLLNQITKQKRRDEKMKEENPPIGRKVEGDENMFLDSSEEETEEILLVPEPNQQKQNEWMVNKFR